MPRRIHGWTLAIALLLTANAALAQKAPPQAEWDKATADITGNDPATMDAAVEKVRGWVDGGWVSRDLWAKWLPALAKAGRNQDVADLAILGILGRPAPEASVPMMEMRVRALLALNRPQEALMEAKSYYNICDLKLTPQAVDLVAECFGKAHPDDPGITMKFKEEQAKASSAPATTRNATTNTARPKSMLNAVRIDILELRAYDAVIKSLTTKTRFVDRVACAQMLLAADRGQESEKIFRELFQVATTQDELNQATEGIAKSIRAQDGTVARANAWLVALQQSNATKPAATKSN